MPLPEGKTREELGIKPGEKLRFCEDYCGWEKGEVVTVTETNPLYSSDSVEFKDELGRIGSAYLRRFECIEPALEYKKGTRVQVIGRVPGNRYQTGWTGTVSFYDPTSSMDIVNFDNGVRTAVYRNRLKLIDPTPSKPEREPKVGDRIRVTKWLSSDGFRDVYREDYATITEVTNDGFFFKSDKGLRGFFDTTEDNDEWEFVDEPEACSSIDSPQTVPPSIIDISKIERLIQERLEKEFYIPPLYLGNRSHHTITNKKGGSLMSKLSLLAKKAFDKDTKTLIKSGVLDSDLNVRDSQFVLSFLVDQNKAELAKAAQALLDEEKADK